MINNQDTSVGKYIVNIMAHNEEETIAGAIYGVLEQEIDSGREIEIHVFANACTDSTEEIVENIINENNPVVLHSIPEKGKVNAFRRCIAYFRDEKKLDAEQCNNRLFFIDADISMPKKNVLRRLSERLDASENIYLISALPVPESIYNDATDFVSRLFRIRYYLQYSFRKNLVRGACNVIRWSIFRDIVFPEGLVSTDMFLECRLNGHFLMDHSIQVITKLKSSLKLEIKRDLLHLIAREQVYNWRRRGLIKRISPENACKEGFLSPLEPREYFMHMVRRKEFNSIMILGIWMLIYKFNEYRARKIFRESQNRNINLLDYWSTHR